MKRSYENVLRDMHNDVMENVAEAKDRKSGWEARIRELKDQLTSSGKEMAGIKRFFSIWTLFRTRVGSGMTAEEAREAADMYGKYAEVVDRINDEQQELGAAQVSLEKAADDIEKRTNVQTKVEDLMDALGLIEQ